MSSAETHGDRSTLQRYLQLGGQFAHHFTCWSWNQLALLDDDWRFSQTVKQLRQRNQHCTARGRALHKSLGGLQVFRFVRAGRHLTGGHDAG